MRYKPLPASFYKRNRKKVIEKLLPDSLVLIAANEPVISKGDQYYTFVQNPNFFYLTGLEMEKAILALCPQHPSSEFREILFAPRIDEKQLRWTGKIYTEETISHLSAIEKTLPLDEFQTHLKELLSHSRHVYLDIDSFVDSEHNFNPNIRLLRLVQSSCPFHKIETIKPLLTEMRLVKTEEEIEQIKYAIEITEQTFFELLPLVQASRFEYEIEAQILSSFLKRGADGYAFHPIVASGKNATILHYFQNCSMLRENELLLIDMGASYGNYCADITRTLPISRKFTKRQLSIYQVVLNVLEFATPLFKPGTTIEQINKEVIKFLEKPLLDLGLITQADISNDREKAVRKFFMHGVSHFVGLDVHDVGTKHTPFQAGMILTCEPGLYIDEENIGIRLENMLLITSQSPVVLTSKIPLLPHEIEKLMS